jgi:HisA/HisF family protein
MRVIGVIDLVGGRAVHARAGQRATYAPVEAIAGTPIHDGDPVALAHAYVDRFGLEELYVADLDAIAGGMPQQTALRRLASIGVPLWLDAGIASADRARLALDLGASSIVVGLETLSSFDPLAEICAVPGSRRVAFSLDLRDGEPIGSAGSGLEPHEIAGRATAAGAAAVIVLDLARVGTGRGPDVSVIIRVRQAIPGVMLLAGGGVRGLNDLTRLAGSGCDGALVATALHNGGLDVAEAAMARQFACRH